MANMDRVSELLIFLTYLSHLCQIKLDNRFKGSEHLRTNIYMAIDGIHFRISEPFPFSKKWFSHKF